MTNFYLGFVWFFMKYMPIILVDTVFLSRRQTGFPVRQNLYSRWLRIWGKTYQRGWLKIQRGFMNGSTALRPKRTLRPINWNICCMTQPPSFRGASSTPPPPYAHFSCCSTKKWKNLKIFSFIKQNVLSFASFI